MFLNIFPSAPYSCICYRCYDIREHLLVHPLHAICEVATPEPVLLVRQPFIVLLLFKFLDDRLVSFFPKNLESPKENSCTLPSQLPTATTTSQSNYEVALLSDFHCSIVRILDVVISRSKQQQQILIIVLRIFIIRLSLFIRYLK